MRSDYVCAFDPCHSSPEGFNSSNSAARGIPQYTPVSDTSSTVPVRRPCLSRIISRLPMPGSIVPVRRPVASRRVSRFPMPGSIVPVRRPEASRWINLSPIPCSIVLTRRPLGTVELKLQAAAKMEPQNLCFPFTHRVSHIKTPNPLITL